MIINSIEIALNAETNELILVKKTNGVPQDVETVSGDYCIGSYISYDLEKVIKRHLNLKLDYDN